MSKEIRLEPSYYEWHLLDENNKILLNITDADIEYANTQKELLETIDNVWEEASEKILQKEEFNGIETEYLDDAWKFIVAKRLFAYYGYSTEFLEKVERFRSEALLVGFALHDLGILDWYNLFEMAQQG